MNRRRGIKQARVDGFRSGIRSVLVAPSYSSSPTYIKTKVVGSFETDGEVRMNDMDRVGADIVKVTPSVVHR